MRTASPLRYPGGKSVMTDLLAEIRRLNGLGSRPIAEPFAGGAGASLSLLYMEETPAIFINDADLSIHDFWWTLIHRPEPFMELLQNTGVSMAEWRRQRETYRSSGRVSRLRRGFSAFYLNRCNRSGIIMNGGPIGGVNQTGKWKLGARFNKPELRRRCERVSEYRERVTVSALDGIEFINSLDLDAVHLFIDPPYFGKGSTLYMSNLDDTYHANLAALLRSKPESAWTLTYDDCPEIRKRYRSWATVRPFALRYVAADRKKGQEILIAPKWMGLPSSQASKALQW